MVLVFLPLAFRALRGRVRLAHMEKAPDQGMLGYGVGKTDMGPKLFFPSNCRAVDMRPHHHNRVTLVLRTEHWGLSTVSQGLLHEA